MTEMEMVNRGQCQLPCDIIRQIFYRLDVKTLCKYRCVSKSWQALVQDSHFQSCHYECSKKNPKLFVLSFKNLPDYKLYSCDIKEPSIPFRYMSAISDKEDTLITEVRRSCIDLICLFNRSDIYIYNPTMKYQITLPKSPWNYEDSIGCACGPIIGYISSTSEYKVARTYYSKRRETGLEFEVFTLGTNKCWRNFDLPDITTFRRSSLSVRSITCVGEFVYLFVVALSEVALPVVASPVVIIRFNLEKEEWCNLSIKPPFAHEEMASFMIHNNEVRLTQLSEQLCMAHCIVGERLNIWLLEVCDHSSYVWTKGYSIDHTSTCNIGAIIPLRVENDGRLLLEDEFNLKYYDPKSNNFQIFCEIDNYMFCFFSVYVESFKSLKPYGCNQR